MLLEMVYPRKPVTGPSGQYAVGVKVEVNDNGEWLSGKVTRVSKVGLGTSRKVVSLQVELAESRRVIYRVGLDPCSIRGMESKRMRRALRVHRLLMRYINVVMLRETPGHRKSNKLRKLGGEIITVSSQQL